MSVDEVRQFDRLAIERYAVPSIVLMENAARGCVDWLETLGIARGVLVCCGPGNNGGDGLAMARHLTVRGVPVYVALLGDPGKLSQDSSVNWRIVQQLGLPTRIYTDGDRGLDSWLVELRPDIDWVVDALLGTGSKLPLRAPLDGVVRCLNEQPLRRFAIDLPTGLDADDPHSADDMLAICAEATATLVARKPVMRTEAGRRFCGEIKVLDIGVPLSLGESV